ncbi:cell division protein FtsZ [Nitritalea halalkaliphila LW7]|uniref:Cell division protein FtsZ n=2 Tax=Nitritalea TaxID=1187887 RepID=I5C2E1_9BACT|nr:cell division protein FtsZ [Nitritalea halalkaliphila LW7]
MFDLPKNHKSIIKVVGVGGGGSNAVNHMYNQGIKDVEFVVMNTDAQALQSSPVPNKLQIGTHLTEGLGAGANPERGKEAAVESKEEIRDIFGTNTKMVFITAGMGGGTGTGAAPVIAKIARDMDILTVGIVTAPFAFEGRKKILAAQAGIEELKSSCDTVLVILNDKLRDVYGNLAIRSAFAKADNVLTTAAKSIAEIITVHQDINVDFEDVKTVMKNAGAAVMGSALEEGENRALHAAERAIASPLLNNVDIKGAKKILLSVTSGEEDELSMDELTEITDYINACAGSDLELIFGQGIDPSLGKAVRVTVIATGFMTETLPLVNAPGENKAAASGAVETSAKQDHAEQKAEKPEAPIAPASPAAPQASAAPQSAAAPSAPEAPQSSVTPSTPEAPQTSGVPEATLRPEAQPERSALEGTTRPANSAANSAQGATDQPARIVDLESGKRVEEDSFSTGKTFTFSIGHQQAPLKREEEKSQEEPRIRQQPFRPIGGGNLIQKSPQSAQRPSVEEEAQPAKQEPSANSYSDVDGFRIIHKKQSNAAQDTNSYRSNHERQYEQTSSIVGKRLGERGDKLKALRDRWTDPESLKELEKPAYLRNEVKLHPVPSSSEVRTSQLSLNDTEGLVRGGNRFLDKNVD